MTDVINCGAGLGPAGNGQHDEPVTAPTPPFAGPGLPALRRLTLWVTAACLLVIAVLVGSELAGAGSPWALVAGLPAVAGVCVAAGLLFAFSILGRPVPRAAHRHAMAGTAALVAGALLVVSRLAAEGGFPWPLLLAAVLAAAHAAGDRPWQRVWPAGLGLALAASLFGSWWGGALSWPGAVLDTAVVALGAGGLLAQVWMLRVAERLDRARRLESAAAVTGERLRFAADLHDIQGHSLQVIALKSELAERLAVADPQRAVAEMREVQELARQALGDTRAVVQGYRRVTLETEMANAARVLTAAGIDCRVERDPAVPGASGLPDEVATLLGLVVREGTTNVLRHSAARRCTIALSAAAGVLCLRIGNDAPLGERPGPAGGLATLAERLSAAGGALRWHADPGEFTVEADLPAVPGSTPGFADADEPDREARR
jgi:two-component system sensor histidine kinase DesK